VTSLYLDHAATSPLRPEAREAFLRASELGGNASSIHAFGRKAKLLLEEARRDRGQCDGASAGAGF
jgi:cysteine desulfurase